MMSSEYCVFGLHQTTKVPGFRFFWHPGLREETYSGYPFFFRTRVTFFTYTEPLSNTALPHGQLDVLRPPSCGLRLSPLYNFNTCVGLSNRLVPVLQEVEDLAQWRGQEAQGVREHSAVLP